MAERIRKLTNSEVEVLARIIADTMTGSQMNEIFQECGVQDVSNESTKWKRIYYTFLARQEQDGASNSFLNFIKKSLKPVRFISIFGRKTVKRHKMVIIVGGFQSLLPFLIF